MDEKLACAWLRGFWRLRESMGRRGLSACQLLGSGPVISVVRKLDVIKVFLLGCFNGAGSGASRDP